MINDNRKEKKKNENERKKKETKSLSKATSTSSSLSLSLATKMFKVYPEQRKQSAIDIQRYEDRNTDTYRNIC